VMTQADTSSHFLKQLSGTMGNLPSIFCSCWKAKELSKFDRVFLGDSLLPRVSYGAATSVLHLVHDV